MPTIDCYWRGKFLILVCHGKIHATSESKNIRRAESSWNNCKEGSQIIPDYCCRRHLDAIKILNYTLFM